MYHIFPQDNYRRRAQPGNLNVNEQEQHLITFGSAIAANKGVVKDEIFNSVRSFYSDEQLVIFIAVAGPNDSHEHFQ